MRARVRGDSGDEEEDEDEETREREIVLPANAQRRLTGEKRRRYPKRDSNKRGGLEWSQFGPKPSCRSRRKETAPT